MNVTRKLCAKLLEVLIKGAIFSKNENNRERRFTKTFESILKMLEELQESTDSVYNLLASFKIILVRHS